MKRIIKAAQEVSYSAMSIDFLWSDDYDYREVQDAVEEALNNCGVECMGVDIHGVDYSSYPEYDSYNVSQIGADFRWTTGYNDIELEYAVKEALSDLGYEVIGISFESLLRD